jgi:hypothetical protein
LPGPFSFQCTRVEPSAACIVSLTLLVNRQDEAIACFSTEHRDKYLVLVEDEGADTSGGLDSADWWLQEPAPREGGESIPTAAPDGRPWGAGAGQEAGCEPSANSPDSLLAASDALQDYTPGVVQVEGESLHPGARAKSESTARQFVPGDSARAAAAGEAGRGGAGEQRRSVAASGSGIASGRATPRGAKRGMCTPRRSGPGTAAGSAGPAGGGGSPAPRVTSRPSSPRARTPRATAAEQGGGVYQPPKGAGGRGGGSAKTVAAGGKAARGAEAAAAAAQAGGAHQPLVAGAGPASPAKGSGEVMKGDDGTWSPFFCNQVWSPPCFFFSPLLSS